MKPPKKQRLPRQGQPVPPLTRLKQQPLAEREWAYSLAAKMTQEEARGEIRERLGISLGADSSYSHFVNWMFQRQRAEKYSDAIERVQEFYKREHPEKSLEQVREVGIAVFMAEALEEKDREGFADVARLHLAQNKGVLEVEKFKLDRDKHQFKAAKACLAELPALKAISSDKSLSEDEKIDRIRMKLFGVIADSPPKE